MLNFQRFKPLKITLQKYWYLKYRTLRLLNYVVQSSFKKAKLTEIITRRVFKINI